MGGITDNHPSAYALAVERTTYYRKILINKFPAKFL
jgi:hypothetical protein